MPTTRKKIIKTVYKDDDSEQENDGHDFSDSGSEAVISEHDQSSSDEEEDQISSDDDFVSSKNKIKRPATIKKTNNPSFSKSFISKINRQNVTEENDDVAPVQFSVKDLTAADKLLPSILNLSESDSSDDELPKEITKKNIQLSVVTSEKMDDSDIDTETAAEYKDVWSNNIQNDSEEIAKKTFLELEQHKSKIEETKMSIQNYTVKMDTQTECDVKDLLALGEEEIPQPSLSSQSKRGKKKIRNKIDSDSEMEDWEEVNEAKGIPQQGLQLIVDVPNSVCRKTKKLDVEMMMRRKMNRVKKEYQVYMHKVHVLCWLGHGNYVSCVLNDQTILADALSLVPSKECYPGERVDMKYIEQITAWFKDKIILKQDKNENKFRPKSPPLKEILQHQVKSRVFTTKKYIIFIFVSMLRSLGLQCRVMFNFVTLPIKPPSFELCSLSTKSKDKQNEKNKDNKQTEKGKVKKGSSDKSKKVSKDNIPQLDGIYDMSCSSESDYIMQVDGSDDGLINRNRRQRSTKKHLSDETKSDVDSVSPPKKSRRNLRTKPHAGLQENKVITKKQISPQKANSNVNSNISADTSRNSSSTDHLQTQNNKVPQSKHQKIIKNVVKSMEPVPTVSQKKNSSKLQLPIKENTKPIPKKASAKVPEIIVTNENTDVSSKYFENDKSISKKRSPLITRKRSKTAEPVASQSVKESGQTIVRTRSAQRNTESKYFTEKVNKPTIKKSKTNKNQPEDDFEDEKRISHRDLHKKTKARNDVTDDLIQIVKQRVKDAKTVTKKLMVKGKIKKESDEDSDYLPVQSPKCKISESDDDFKPRKIIPKEKLRVKKVDRRVFSTDDESAQHNTFNKTDVWCEVFVEELEEWIAVDVIKGSVHCVNEIYSRATHPLTYVVGWDNNNYLKDLTRKYVPHWNTITRKQRVEPAWWQTAIKPWLGPKTARDREEDERLDRMQLEAPLPKTISEYKNHPLYALKRHLLKFEAIYPPDAATLGFVRGEPVYARECVYVCRSRDTWLKEARVVKLGEQPYKIVKARPKWDKLSNKCITDKPLEVFGPWQCQDYEPPVAENGIVPRNAYGNVELFKECMLPKGTVHLKLPGLNRVAKKLNIDCAPAMTGFDFNGGWSHPVYDGFVVCKEFGEIVTEAWLKDQEDQERKEIEKTEARVYGNWRKLIRGLLIKERLKAKYGFEEPSTSQDKNKKGPRLVVKKK